MRAALRLAVVAGLGLCPTLPRAAAAQASDRPNVVLIITDDLGAADVGVYGARDIRTPNIDRLAREGVRFTDFYANGTTCSPTRAGLITGRYQQRYGVEQPLEADGALPPGQASRGLEASPHSLPRLLKSRGYATGLVGKWHLGYAPSQSPMAHGFDEFFGLKSGYHDYWQHTDSRGQPDLWANDQPVQVEGYSTDLIASKAVDFIRRHAETPFFLDVAFNAPHWPFQRPEVPSTAIDHARFLLPADEPTGSRADYVAMVERLDRSVGEILAAIERHGLTRRTIVIFTNDNGGEWLSDNGPFFHRKWTTWEGGIRVPAIVRWPARLPAGRVTSQVGITMDWTASILAATGVPVPPEVRLDGMNLFDVLAGAVPTAERTLYWRAVRRGHAMLAVRRGDLKLVLDGAHQLVYDVRRDPGERRDLARQRPEVARRLRLALDAWIREVDAEAATRR